MEKENGSGGDTGAAKEGLFDAASLFGAYWGREGGSAAAQAQAALFGFGGRYPPNLGVAANQAASLGIHPAANAAWWSMASHLAAQDYLARLHASGINFPIDPYSMGRHKSTKPTKNDNRSGRNSSSSTGSSASSKDKIPPASSAQSNMRPPYTSQAASPAPPLSSLASLNSLVSNAHNLNKPVSSRKPPKVSSSSAKEREMAALRNDLMLAGAQGAYHAAMQAAKGKNVPPFNPFGLPTGLDKDRHTGLESLAGLPHNLLSDPASVLGGVRLPPDTEIIKYTSSMQGAKVPSSSSTRGRKKTISLDPPHVSVLPSPERNSTPPTKRHKSDKEYGSESSGSGVQVIRLPSRQQTPVLTKADCAGLSKELLQSIANQSGLTLAALERELAGATSAGLNLSSKSSHPSTSDQPLDLGASSVNDDDAPLNLSLKPSSSVSMQASDALSRLTSLSSSLNAGSNSDRISRRKPGAKPRRVMPDGEPEPMRPRSSGSDDSESVSSWGGAARPRNLGRGVSKPKKNTVASLLAQSRALGLRASRDNTIEKLRALLGDVSTDSECRSDSDSDAGGPALDETCLRLPLASGWNRVTIIKGLSRSGGIKGDVLYTSPEPNSVEIRSMQELVKYLNQNSYVPLTRDNFTFSSRRILGEYRQNDISYSEAEILQRLEEARALAGLAAGRPTPPPPVDRRIELARQQQAARDRRRDRGRDQARLARELERSEKAEQAKRDKEARNQQMLEHIHKNRTQLSIQLVPQTRPKKSWTAPDISLEPATRVQKPRHIAPISLSLIPVSKEKDSVTINVDQSGWKDQIEYNALDKMMDFAKSSFPKDFVKDKKSIQEENYERLVSFYSRMTDFINKNAWSKEVFEEDITSDAKEMEKRYIKAKNKYMSTYFNLEAKQESKSVLREERERRCESYASEEDRELARIQRQYEGITMTRCTIKDSPARRRKQEESERRVEEQAKRQQERELKRQQAVLVKEQKYITEERERRRQHTALVRQLELRKRWEERERRKHRSLMQRLLGKEEKLRERSRRVKLLAQLRRPQEDSSLSDQKPLPALSRIAGLKLPGQAMGDALQVIEFVHNFGQTLGFDMESIPSLNTLQMGLLPDCCTDAEDQLMTLLTHLLVCAIEDPGIPHPGRHTTLLGHALRMGDITPTTISEVLRIYLYANATGQVKAVTGINQERERERRVADHHQTDEEMQSAPHNAKNQPYYDHLYSNPVYKLSEALRDKPFLALSATTKGRILAFLCDELLQNKSVLRQIEASLDRHARLKKERFLHDIKIRKVRSLHQRKSRAEQTEKQQALALERMHKLVEESCGDSKTNGNDDEHSMGPPSNRDTPPKEIPSEESSPFKDEDPCSRDRSVEKDVDKEESSPAEVSKLDKDSVCDGDALSDMEGEEQTEEDEDKNLSSEELAKKLEKLMRHSEQQQKQLTAALYSIRAVCHGQDRYWRRYWSLGATGGVFVEAMESAQPELMEYQNRLEAAARRKEEGKMVEADRKRGRRGQKDKKSRRPSQEEAKEKDPSVKTEDEIKSELELKNIKSELNLSDHTQIIKYEPNIKGHSKLEGSAIKMEERYIQQKQNNELDMLDIEDSIPTAFLVQKPTHNKPVCHENENPEKPVETKAENANAKGETPEEEIKEEEKEQVNNLEELRKMTEVVAQIKKDEIEEVPIKEEKPKIKDEIDSDLAHQYLHTKMLEGRWFSILRKEHSLLSVDIDSNEKSDKTVPEFTDNTQTCSEIILSHGHKWDVSNNLHLLNDPSLFTLNSMVTTTQVPVNNYYPDSSLTMSGIDQDILDDENLELDQEESDNNDLEKELLEDDEKDIKRNTGNHLGLLNFNALSTYVTCDSPPPLQMTPEEFEQLENCKTNGLPKKVEGNFVPKELRHGWWRITDKDTLQALLDALHPRGVRERELYSALTQQLTVNNKLQIDARPLELSISNRDRVIAQSGGYPRPDLPGDSSDLTACKIDTVVLNQIEQLEERVTSASLQVKGWAVCACEGGAVERARAKLAALEANIERRYLKPPLQSSGEASLGAAVLQAEQSQSAQSPQTPKSDGGYEAKECKGGRALQTWRQAVRRCQTSSQLAMCLSALEASIAWDKSIMKANCQFCQSGDNDDQLLLCDGCDKGYHMYCFKPKMEKIPDGDWYCWECVNKARGSRVCIVCGCGGRLLACALCSRAYHHACRVPPVSKTPRGKWYCDNCISKAPPKKPRAGKKRDSKRDVINDGDAPVPSPAPSFASTSTGADDSQSLSQRTPEKHNDQAESEENGHDSAAAAEFPEEDDSLEPPEQRPGNGVDTDTEETGRRKGKRHKSDLQLCRNLLEEMEVHQDAWPFLLPVNTKQFPTYKKVIRTPMDLSTIKKKLNDASYKSKEEFAEDVRQIFTNCEVFNEDESPVGRAGHGMRSFFTQRFSML